MDAYKEIKTDISKFTDDEYYELVDKTFQDRPDSFLCVDNETILVGPEATLEDLPEKFRSFNIEYMSYDKHEKPVECDHPTLYNTLSCPPHSSTLTCNEGSSSKSVDSFDREKRQFQLELDQRHENRMFCYENDITVLHTFINNMIADGDRRSFDSLHRLVSTTLSFKEGYTKDVDDSYTDIRVFKKKSRPKKRSSNKRKAI